MSDVAAFSGAQKIRAPRHSHSHDKSVFSDTAKKSALTDAAKFSELRKHVHSHSHDKSVFSDMFSNVASFSDTKKRRAPRHSHSYDKSLFSSQRSVALQR